MKQPIASVFELYISRKNLAESSIEIKSRAVRFFVEMFGDMDVRDITYGHIEDFAVSLQKGRSNLSANIYLKNFKPFFAWLKSRGIIKNNPCDNLILFREEIKDGEVFEPWEIERVLKIAPMVWKGIFIMGLCGMRRGEILNITVKNIFFDKDYILIAPKKETETTWPWSIKNHIQRIVPLPRVINLSDEVIDVQVLLMDIIDSNPAKQPYVFVPSKYYEKNMALMKQGKLTHYLRGCPWPNFTRSFHNILRRAGVAIKKCHDSRASFATTMLNNGVSLAKVQILLGHSTPAITAKYARFKKTDLIKETNQVLKNCYSSNVP